MTNGFSQQSAVHLPAMTTLVVPTNAEPMTRIAHRKAVKCIGSSNEFQSFLLTMVSTFKSVTDRFRRAMRHRSIVKERFIRRSLYRQSLAAKAEAAMPEELLRKAVSRGGRVRGEGLRDVTQHSTRHENDRPAAQTEGALS